MNKLFTFVLFLLAGAVSAVLFMYILGSSPVRFDNPVLTSVGIKKPEIVGFLPYWLIAKADKEYGKYITTLTYFGLTVGSDGHIQKLTNPREEEPGWTTLKKNEFKRYNAKQSLLVISGDDGAIGEMLNDPVTSANNLVADIAPVMKQYGFTDLNIDIETFMEASESARANFTTFVVTLKDALDATITIDLIPIALVKPKLYDAKALGEIVDRVVLMTYDYHYSGSFTAGAVAPVGGAGKTMEFDVEMAVIEALKVIPAHKLLLGIPLYGYQWETIGSAPESATIPGGSATASTRRIADILASCATCSAVLDPISQEPHLIYPEGAYFNQIYYENEASMKEKIALAQKYHLGGVALWALGYEDGTILNPLAKYKNTLDLSGLY